LQEYVLKRLALAIPILLGVSFLVAGLIRLVPGDAILLKLEQAGHVENLDEARRALGLDRSFPEQYLSWLAGVLRGDFGTSFTTDRPILPAVLKALPVTVELAVLSLLIAFLLGVPIGVLSAVRQDTWADYAGRLLSVAGLSVPSFWIATLVLLYFSLWFRWIPPITYVPFTENPWANLQQFLVPAAALGGHFSATSMRMTRSALLEVLRQDYIRTAAAKGLGALPVVGRHAVKNAMIPVVTVLGVQFSHLLGGTVIVETIFSMPGLGRLTLDAILQRDYPQLQANVLIVAAMVVLLNVVVDLLYAWLDPRIHYR
jgi:peptide/nickel transport system permease protein